MRASNRRKSRSSLTLDIHKLYIDGLNDCFHRPLDVTPLDQTDVDVEFCLDILTRDPHHVEALTLLGEVYSRKGDYIKGLEADLRLSKLCPDSGVIHYNLACSYALTGAKEKALNTLVRAIDLGYRDVEHLKSDGDLVTLKDDPRYLKIVSQLNEEIAEQA
jgi:tetratricopeptide (TPR) repeat protein